MTKIAFNKYCIDCKKNITSHFHVFYGIFLCSGCADQHLEICEGRLSRCYIKDVLAESWDDYQLRSVENGGNGALYEILKEYNIIELEFTKRYKHEAVQWHRKRNLWLMEAENEGKVFPEPKPAKNMDERLERAKSFTKEFG